MIRLRVDGRVAGDAVPELAATCERALAGGAQLMIDLSGAPFADADGVALIEALRERGTVVIGCSPFLSELLRSDGGDAEIGGEPGEATLLERLRRGDGDAYEEIVRRHGGRMLATARRMLGNEHAAEDAVQEAFLSAFRAIDQFAGTAKLSTWLHRIVVNVVLMRMRSRRARPESSIEDLLPRFDGDGAWADRIGGSEASSEALLGQGETRALVRRCIDQLPPTYRSVVMLRDIEELDTEEAAAVLGITPNAVKIRLHRARQALRTLLDGALRPGERAADLRVSQ